MYGPNWPAGGEIDIIEGVNAQTTNQMTLHTSEGCDVTVGSSGQSGTPGSITDCGYDGGSDGCSVVSNTANSYGTGFDSVGGGVYAMHWNASEIKIWMWPRSSIPTDISKGSPFPDTWGAPQASWAGCAFDTYFSEMNIVSPPYLLRVKVMN